MRVRTRLGVGALMLIAPAVVAPASGSLLPAARTTPALVVCDQPPGDPAPGTVAWEERDLNNIECATQRQQDELTNPDFLRAWAVDNGELDPGFETSAVLNQLEHPTHLVLPIGDIALTKIGDPLRVPTTWQEAGRGQQTTLTMDSTTGAHLNARLYWPNGPGPFPGVVMVPGLQAYNEIYEWLGEGLAESGYMVLIPDPQGQGSSEALPHAPDGSIGCAGKPPANSGCPNFPTNDVPEVQSALDFLVSSPQFPDLDGGPPGSTNARGTLPYNPAWQLVDRSEIGVAGHSMGALAVTTAGQKDSAGYAPNVWPVRAVVSMDNLGERVASGVTFHVPALYFDVDYPFPSVLAPQLPSKPPNPQHYIDDTFSQTVAAGVDSMVIVPRASTHYEFDYLPFPASLPASRDGERVAFYYILAWFDKYLKDNVGRDGHTATQRLTGTFFDGSADASSIGVGTFDASGNVPYTIGGKCVSNLLSFYYQSAYWLDGGTLENDHMENPLGCP